MRSRGSRRSSGGRVASHFLTEKTETISGRITRSPAWNPLRCRAATVLFSAGSSVGDGGDGALPAGVERVALDQERLDPLPVEDVLDPLLEPVHQADEPPASGLGSPPASGGTTAILPMSSWSWIRSMKTGRRVLSKRSCLYS